MLRRGLVKEPVKECKQNKKQRSRCEMLQAECVSLLLVVSVSIPFEGLVG